MYTSRMQPHYMPASVGALMDTAFLRQVVSDEERRGRPETVLPTPGQARWRSAMVRIAATLRRLVGGR